VCSEKRRRRRFSIWLRLFGPESTILCHRPQKLKDSNPRPCATPPLPPKDSNQRPCATPPLTPQSFGHTTMHYITIDPKKTKIYLLLVHPGSWVSKSLCLLQTRALLFTHLADKASIFWQNVNCGTFPFVTQYSTCQDWNHVLIAEVWF
jgi:hypothetical protein